MDLLRHRQRELDRPSGSRRIKFHLVRLGAAAGAPALALAIETDLECGSGVVAGVGVGGRGDGRVDCRCGLLLLDEADAVTDIAGTVKMVA